MKRDWNPGELEMMDRPQPVSAELERDLDNLRGLNEHFGSYRLVCHFLRRWLKSGERYRVLDLCTGSGDIPRMMIDWARARGIELVIDAVDFHSATLEIAKDKNAAYPEIRFLQADAREFIPPEWGAEENGSSGIEGTPPAPYDFVHCSLALHHFSEEDAVRILKRCRELSRRYLLVADLERSWLTVAAVWLVTAIVYRDPMTKYDGRQSARRAFSWVEFQALARQAGWRRFVHRSFLPCRQAISLEQ